MQFNSDFKYWGNAEYKLDLTSFDDAAKYTIAAVSNPTRVGDLNLRGDKKSVVELAQIYSKVKGVKKEAVRAGSVQELKDAIDGLNKAGKHEDAYGLGFMFVLFNEKGALDKVHIDEFKELKPTSFEEFLKSTKN